MTRMYLGIPAHLDFTLTVKTFSDAEFLRKLFNKLGLRVTQVKTCKFPKEYELHIQSV